MFPSCDRGARASVVRRRSLRRDGTAIVELAVLLPFMVFVLLVGTDWCRIYYAAHTLDDCARSGAFAASGIGYQERNLSTSERTSRAMTEILKDAANLNPPIDAADVSVVTAGSSVTVTVNYKFKTITSYLGKEWPLTRTVSMPLQP